MFCVITAKPTPMKTKTYIILLLVFSNLLISCSVWNKAFPPKYGCEGNGKNVGAEKLMDGSKPPKAKKFRA